MVTRDEFSRPDLSFNPRVDERRREVASRTRRAKVALLALTLALLVLGVWAWVNGGPLWEWVMTETVPTHEFPNHLGHVARSVCIRQRWGGEVLCRICYSTENGLIAICAQKNTSGEWVETSWRFDGTVERQLLQHCGTPLSYELKTSPPWLLGVTDQTEPTIPAWMKDDAKWQAALDAQRK